MRLVFHDSPFYGQMNTSEACPSTGGITCKTDLGYKGIEQYCKTGICEIPAVSPNALELKQCKDSSNYLTLYHSCQPRK